MKYWIHLFQEKNPKESDVTVSKAVKSITWCWRISLHFGQNTIQCSNQSLKVVYNRNSKHDG